MEADKGDLEKEIRKGGMGYRKTGVGKAGRGGRCGCSLLSFEARIFAPIHVFPWSVLYMAGRCESLDCRYASTCSRNILFS